MDPLIKHLPSGWILIWFSQECFAQIPSGCKDEDKIPDEYIFNPEWNRDQVNDWMKNMKGKG